ncbi:protein ALP1-like [Senna tora]|uniref:Protein ALP1-like n=1 Tax=Senna tora TaxID=362788 RepID=A0A834X056_9FABA|nr:protein ALP1-like [Senna tora]
MRHISPRSYTLDFEAKRAHLRSMVYASDTTCYNQIRIKRATFDQLCGMLHNIKGLNPTRNMLVDEQVAIFLHILCHHVKNRVIQLRFGRSRETISRYVHTVLQAMMKLVPHLFKKPEPVGDDSTDDRWKWFKPGIVICNQKVEWTEGTRRQDRELDPLENQDLDEDTQMGYGDPIGTVETSDVWTAFRYRLAVDMFVEFRG